MGSSDITQEMVDSQYDRLKREAEEGGYHLNPDVGFTKDILRGLLVNDSRYGYWACPCRLAAGLKDDDLDVICPCDYRDEDLGEFGACYCALYVSAEIADGKKSAGSIPERRPSEEQRRSSKEAAIPKAAQGASYTAPLPVWRCKVCGYLAARKEPPGVCPICKAQQDRFERFISEVVSFSPSLPIWRCRVCGYLAARNEAPETCPICKVPKDRFEKFM